MKLIKPSYTILEQESGLEEIYKAIERAGKVSHKSEHTIKEGSAKEFVDRMIKLGHGAALEFGTVYLKVTYKDTDWVTLSMFYGHNKYSKVTHSEDNRVYYISTNYRVLVENNHLRDLKYLCEPTEYHEKRICVKFILDRGILAEFTRHRVFSFMAESSRYCNYSKDRFGNELTFIIPVWEILEEGSYQYNLDNQTYTCGNNFYCPEGCNAPDYSTLRFLDSLRISELNYLDLLNLGWKPEQARAVLPNALKTELVMTGFVSDWRHFFRLRTSIIAETGKPHPQASELADLLYKEFVKRGYINESSN